jgi:hypothetical protein
MVVVAIGQLTFVLACGTVGLRLLIMHRRTGMLPELLLGIGLLCMVTGVPLLALSGLGRGLVGDLRFAPMIFGLGLFSLSMICLCAFTWRTFRPEARWGGLVVATVGSAQVAAAIGAAAVLAATGPEIETTAAAVGWLVALRVPGIVNFVWTGSEAYRQWRMARRRLAVGIGDPVVTNRFALWCAVGVFCTANNLVSTWLQSRGMGPVAHPAGAALIALSGVISAALLWLVFMTPERYRAWVTRRHTASVR